MYAIRRKRSGRWLSKIHEQVPVNSTKRLELGMIPLLYENELLARLEVISQHLSLRAWEIVEVEVSVKKSCELGKSLG